MWSRGLFSLISRAGLGAAGVCGPDAPLSPDMSVPGGSRRGRLFHDHGSLASYLTPMARDHDVTPSRIPRRVWERGQEPLGHATPISAKQQFTPGSWTTTNIYHDTYMVPVTCLIGRKAG
jgi:hypothetical protein